MTEATDATDATDPTTQHAPPHTKPRRRWRWYHNLCAFFALLILAFITWHLYLYRAIEAQLNAIRAQGLPATPAELERFHPQIPDDQNAALIYLDAATLLRGLPDPDRQSRVPIVGNDYTSPSNPWDAYTPDSIELLTEYINLNQPAFDRASQAAPLTQSRYPADYSLGVDTILAHLMPHRDLIKALAARTNLSIAQNQSQTLTDSVLIMIDLSRSLENEPFLISQLVLTAEQHSVTSGLERALNHFTLTDQQLLTLLEALGAAAQHNPGTTGLIGERAIFYSSLAFLSNDLPGTERVFALFWSGLGVHRYHKLMSYSYHQQLLDAQTLPFTERSAVAAEISREVNSSDWPGFFVNDGFPALERFQTLQARWAARNTTALTALAIERYRLANNNQPPDSLEQLAPTYIESIPRDPFNGNPLRYTKTPENNYTVYSVGEDITDDGGARRNPAGDEFEPGSDIVFEVRR